MTVEEAIKYCEEHECTECEAKEKDKRTKQEWLGGTPCFMNLVDCNIN